MKQTQAIFVAIAFLIPVVAYVSNIAMAALAAISVVGIIYLSATRRQPISFPPQTVISALFLLGLWAAISSGWSPNSGKSMSGALKVLVIFFIGYILIGGTAELDTKTARKTIVALLIACCLTVAALIIDASTDNSLSDGLRSIVGYKKATPQHAHKTYAVVIALMIWPLLSALPRHNKKNIITIIFFVSAIASALLVSFIAGYSSGMVAISAGALVMLLVLWFGYRGARVIGYLMLSSFAIVPIAASFGSEIADMFSNIFPDELSAQHRLYIWDAAADLISKNLFIGWGKGASGLIASEHISATPLATFQTNIFKTSMSSALPLHPHNAVLQIWLELGLIGAVICATAVRVVYTSAIKRAKDLVSLALVCGQLVTAFIILNLSFSVWQSWWLSTLWMAAAMMSISLRAQSSAHATQN